MLKTEDYSKITISDLCAAAGINRKTFYYHFHTLDQLLEWAVERETIDVLMSYDLNHDFEKEVSFIMDYIEKNFELLQSVNKTVGRGAVHKFIYRNLYPPVMNALLKRGGQFVEDREYLEFSAEFYTEAVAGILQNWLEKPKLRNRTQIAEYLKLIVERIN